MPRCKLALHGTPHGGRSWAYWTIGGEWETDGYGDYDSNLVHQCGTMIEMDAERCPECGTPNPIRAMGLI